MFQGVIFQSSRRKQRFTNTFEKNSRMFFVNFASMLKILHLQSYQKSAYPFTKIIKFQVPLHHFDPLFFKIYSAQCDENIN